MKKNGSMKIAIEKVENYIYTVRERRIMLDVDLAQLYEVPVNQLKDQVKRNRDRFPSDFLLELTLEETTTIFSRSPFAIMKRGGNIKYGSYAFTEEGCYVTSKAETENRLLELK